MAAADDLDVEAHVHYFLGCLHGHLPAAFASLDSTRMTLVYFAVSGLDLIGALDRADRHAVVEWVYAQQVAPEGAQGLGGFRGGPAAGLELAEDGATPASPLDGPHLAMTYAALATLAILGDGLRRVEREAVLAGVRALQLPDGSFQGHADGEADVRFVFCAAAISALLGDSGRWHGLNRDAAVGRLVACVTYEGGFGMAPGQEAHGGTTYCALAALALLDALDALPCRAAAVRWCAGRQVGGFQGRANKEEDTCYSWWVGASLAILGEKRLILRAPTAAFTCACQYHKGGLSKYVGEPPDPLHSYFAICGLSLVGHEAVRDVEPTLGISARAWRAHTRTLLQLQADVALPPGARCAWLSPPSLRADTASALEVARWLRLALGSSISRLCVDSTALLTACAMAALAGAAGLIARGSRAAGAQPGS